MPFSLLFSSGRIGKMKLKNRFVMPPMVRNYADKKGLVTPRYIAHVERIAKGGVGMMILEASYVRQDGKGFANQLGIHTDATVAGLKKLARVAHKHGAKIGVQIFHGGRQASSKISGKQPVAPSAIPEPTVMEKPRALTKKEIAVLVADFGKAAARAKRAGMDFVELHGAHGYLITQFLSPFSNKRRDEYGGSPTKRLRFLKEVYEAVRAAVGEDFPIVLRLSGEEMVKGGLTLAHTKRIAQAAEKMGVNALHISVGNYSSYNTGLLIPPMAVPDAPLARLAAGVKSVVNIPIIAVAKIRAPEMAEKILKERKADFIGIGRTLLADPDYPNKVKEGRLDRINKCIACNQACISRLFAQQDVQCTVNPETSRERLFAKKPSSKKRVLVIGGGPAGLSAAKTAAERGHSVTLYEKHADLGGQLVAAGSLPHRGDWLEFLKYLTAEVKRLGVDIRCQTEFKPAMVRPGEYDVAIAAMGSSPIKPNIPGANRRNVVLARDLIKGWVEARGRVVMVGGGCAGAQTAEMLAMNKHPVTIVEMLDAVAADAPSDERALLLARLDKLGVRILTNTKVLSIGSQSVSVQSRRGVKEIPADTVVMCLGSRPSDGLVNELKGLVKKVFLVGDASLARRVTEAVSEGALAALEI